MKMLLYQGFRYLLNLIWSREIYRWRNENRFTISRKLESFSSPFTSICSRKSDILNSA